MDREKYIESFLDAMFNVLISPIHEETVDIGRGEGKIIIYLSNNPDGVNSGKLAEILNVGTGRIGNALKNLEKKGYITRELSKDDKRKVIVKLTEEGFSLADEKNRVFRERINKMIDFMGDDDALEYLRLFRLFVEHLKKEKGE